MRISKYRLAVLLPCTALLLGMMICAVSPVFAAESKKEKLARIKIESGSPYVSMQDEKKDNNAEFAIPANAEIGEQYISGDMIIEVVSKEEIQRVVSEP